MQTFLPYASFKRSAQVLDRKRLGKQRSESKIILNTLLGLYAAEGRKGWPYHPATKMWAGHEQALALYTRIIVEEWIRRGYKQDEADYTWFRHLEHELTNTGMPFWLGQEDFHLAHRSNLLRKFPEHYRQFWPDLPDDLPYIWPV